MENQLRNDEYLKKKLEKTEREWSTALFLLRAVQLGLSMDDLDKLSLGMVMDMFTESSNDTCEYDKIATQEDFDAF